MINYGSLYFDLIGWNFTSIKPKKNDFDEKLRTSIEYVFLSINLSLFYFDNDVINRIEKGSKQLIDIIDVANVPIDLMNKYM